ncbi:hypothetical protein KAR91_57710 [Candidatus Pacearchaeota archaeon]|nr:hypothetical protein [Candidatus Pacearchaeota archaeon]
MNEPIQSDWQSGSRSVICYEREIAELKQQRKGLLDACKAAFDYLPDLDSPLALRAQLYNAIYKAES